jgi:hypothetical protein
MPKGFIAAIIRRSNRDTLLLCFVGGLLLAGFAALNTRYFYNFFWGPFPMDRKALLATADANALEQYFVTIKGDDVVDTGFQEVMRDTKTGSKTVKASYMALLLDERYLIVKAQDDSAVSQFTGYLQPMPSDVRKNIVADAEQSEPELRGAFLPFILQTNSFRGTGYVGLALGIPLFGLCIWGVARSIQRSNDPTTHPIMRALKRFGPPDYVAGQIEAELMADHTKFGALHLTPNWLVQTTPSALNAMLIQDIMWAYKQVTQHRVNGIRAGKTYVALIWDRHGVCITVPGKEAAVNQVLEATAARAPWMLAGYSADLEKAWKTNRATVIETVDQRRKQTMGAIAAALVEV